MSGPFLSPGDVERIIGDGLAACDYDGKRVLVLVPDLTRTMPLPAFFRLIVAALRPRVSRLDFLVALGTHPPLTEAQFDQLFGCAPGERARDFSDIGFLNHDWQNPEALVLLGTIGGAEIAALSDGMLEMDVPVRGDLAQPDFKLSKVIWHAVLNLFGKLVTSPFALLGKAFGGSDTDLSLVAFQPGADTLDPAGLKTLETLEKGLFERPGLRLEMEGTAGEAQDGPALKRAELEASLQRLKGQPLEPQERPKYLKAAFLAAFPPPKETKDTKAVKAAPEPALADMEARLLERVQVDAAAFKLLARRRVQAARDLLLKSGKVEEGRVFIVDGGERAKKEGGPKVYFELK